MKPTRLFSDYELFVILENQKKKIRETSSEVPRDLLLENLEAAVQSVVDRLKFEPIELNESDISIEQDETQVDVSRDTSRFMSDPSQPFYIGGIKVSYFVPFSGDSTLWRCRPNKFTTVLPYGVVSKGELVLEFSVTDGDIRTTKARFEKELHLIRQWLGWQAEMIEAYNRSIGEIARPFLESRLDALKASQSQIGDLGYNLRTKRAGPAEPGRPSLVKSSPKKSSSGRTSTVNYDVALSFAGEDRNYVEQVARLLRDKEIKVFYDEFEKVSLWGKNLVDHLDKVYSQQSRFIVIFVSKHYAVKSWTNHERKSAQSRAVMLQEDCILPARFDDTTIAGMPASIGYIDLRTITPTDFADLIEKKLQT